MPRRLLEGGQVLPAKAHPRTHRRRDGHCSDNWLRRYWIPALASLRSLGRHDRRGRRATHHLRGMAITRPGLTRMPVAAIVMPAKAGIQYAPASRAAPVSQ